MSLYLAIGNKAYSSWSLRPWLLLRQFDVEFTEVRIPLRSADWAQQLAPYSAAGKVPALLDDGLQVWDSLAISEYVSEQFLGGRGWPGDRELRAHARSAVAEMHSGFSAMRNEMNMNLRRLGRPIAASAAAVADVARIQAIWTEALQRSGGPFLYGEFGIADAFFAPVVTRFQSYAVVLPPALQNYCGQILALPAMREWFAAAAAETEVIDDYEQP